MKEGWLVAAAALGACAGPPTLVDMTDVDPVVYQRDLDSCEAVAQGTNAAGPLVAGAIMGASVGAGIGALGGITPSSTVTTGEALGAASGAAAGAGASAATGTPVAAPPPAPRQTVPQCLEAHGYKLIAPPEK